MLTSLPFLPEKFSSALQPGTLLDLLQIEGMKIEEESEVRWGVIPYSLKQVVALGAKSHGGPRNHKAQRFGM